MDEDASMWQGGLMVTVRITPVVEECGPVVEVEGLASPVPVPGVLDIDDGSGCVLRVVYGPGPDRPFALRSLRLSAGEETGQLGAAALRGVSLSLVALCSQNYFASVGRMIQMWGGLADAVMQFNPNPDSQRGEHFFGNTEFIERAPSGQRTLRLEHSDAPEWISEARVRELRKLGPSSPEVIGVVAALGDYAQRQGVGVVRFVQDFLGLPQATASNWVAIARKAGALSSPLHRRSDSTSRTSSEGESEDAG